MLDTELTPFLLAINLLTQDVVKTAASEIQVGKHVQLDWPLEALKFPGFGRRTIGHTILDAKPKLDEYAYDDEITINTQSGSQWDSLKHVSKCLLVGLP